MASTPPISHRSLLAGPYFSPNPSISLPIPYFSRFPSFSSLITHKTNPNLSPLSAEGFSLFLSARQRPNRQLKSTVRRRFYSAKRQGHSADGDLARTAETSLSDLRSGLLSILRLPDMKRAIHDSTANHLCRH